MHELSIAMSILDVVVEEADRRGAAGVEAIRVRIGPLSGVVPDALQSAFGYAREDSPFPTARLIVEEAPIVIRCGPCGAKSRPIALHDLRCSTCGESGTVVAGDELEITALEIAP